MSALGWDAPSPGVVTKLAPTGANALLDCSLRFAFSRDSRTSSLSRKRPATILGTMSHRLTELVLTGQAPAGGNRRAWLEEQWAKLLEEGRSKLAADWPGREVPDPSKWSGLVATRTRLLRRLAELPPVVQHAANGSGPGPATPALPWVERYLADPTTGLYGTADLVEEISGVLRVVDLKSGVRQQEMSGQQRRQLLIYAHLVQVELGRNVAEVATLDARGKESVTEVDQGDVSRAVDEVLAARDAFNDAADRGQLLSRPSEERCAYCPFRVVCSDYWSARRSDWPGRVLRGTVEQTHPGRVVDVEWQGETTRLILAGDIDIGVGTELAVVDLDAAGPGTLRMRWDSVIRLSE